MKHTCIYIFIFLNTISPALSDEISIVIGDRVITKNHVQALTTESLIQTGFNPTDQNKALFYPLWQNRTLQQVLMDTMTNSTQIKTIKNKVMKYTKRHYGVKQSISTMHQNTKKILIAYNTSILKWSLYVKQYIVPNINVHVIKKPTPYSVRKISMITIPMRTNDAGIKALHKIRQKIIAGGDFKKLAYYFSNDISWIQYGNIGWVGNGDTPYKLDRLIWNLSIGQISPIIRIGQDYALIKVEQEKIITSSEQITIQNQLYLLQTEQNRQLDMNKQNLDIKYNND